MTWLDEAARRAQAAFIGNREVAAKHWADESTHAIWKRTVVAALGLRKPPDRVRHKKRGTTYTVLADARAQTEDLIVDNEDVRVYVSELDGAFYVRSVHEFKPTRFDELDPAGEPT